MSLRPHLRRVVAFCVCRYWVVTRLVTRHVRAHSCVRETCVTRRKQLGAWSVRFVGWANWVDCRCLLFFVFLGVARRLELSPCTTEKATAARHRPERQHNARSNRRKQCSPNKTNVRRVSASCDRLWDYFAFCAGVSGWSMIWFCWGCTASCGWHMRCIVIRGDAWLVLLSPCNTNPMQPASHRSFHTRTDSAQLHCVVVRGDAWPLLLSPCNTMQTKLPPCFKPTPLSV